jgi:hypothetical protein
MERFKVNDRIEIVCECKNTRNGFKHVAHLFLGSCEIEERKWCYLNRTWESFRYQSVMLDLVNRSTNLTKEEKQECIDTLKLKS